MKENKMEKHLLITSARYEVTDGGMACGPVSGSVIAEVGFRTPDGEEFFISCAEVMGIPNFYKTERSVIDEEVKVENSGGEFDEEFKDYLMNCFIDGIGEYDEIFENRDPEWFTILRYLIYIVGNDCDETDAFIKDTVGKYLDEIDIPVSSIEKAYAEDEEE